MPSNIVAPRVPFVDLKTGIVAREWYRYLENLALLTGSGDNSMSISDLMLGPPVIPSTDFTASIAALAATVTALTATVTTLSAQVTALAAEIFQSAFRAYVSSSYVETSTGSVIVQYDTIDFDLLNEYNTTTHQWTPGDDGVYVVGYTIATGTDQLGVEGHTLYGQLIEDPSGAATVIALTQMQIDVFNAGFVQVYAGLHLCTGGLAYQVNAVALKNPTTISQDDSFFWAVRVR